ncbi:Tyrosine recombinase XerC [subsurface metagenome]
MSQSLLSVKEVSSFLHVHPKTLYKWTDKGKIPYVRINGLIRFKKQEIESWQEKYRKKTAEFANFLPKFDLSLENYDKMLLKGRSALSKKSKRWNYGFGSVYIRKTKQGKDRWYADYHVNGKRIREVVKNAQNRAEAVLYLQEKVAEAFSQAHNPNKKKKPITFTELADRYINDYAKLNKRSWKQDMYRIEAHLKPFIGDINLNEIIPLHIEKYRAERLKIGVKKSTINRELAILKKMFNLAIDWKFTDHNPANTVKFFSERDNFKERILTKEEEYHLLEASPDHLKSIIKVALNTGIRRGEILNLKWSQIDLGRELIRVEKTKSGKSRVININSELFETLKKIRGENRKGDFVFTNPQTGCPFTTVKSSFKRASAQAKINDLRFHDFRHTFATRLAENGVHPFTMKELLGHSTFKMTERYTHPSQELKKRAVELLVEKSPKKPENLDVLARICHMEKRQASNLLN